MGICDLRQTMLDLRWYRNRFLPSQRSVAKRGAGTRRALGTPEVTARLAKVGIAPYWSSPEDMAALIGRNMEHFASPVKAVGIQPE